MRGGEVRVIFAKGKCDLSELCKGNIFFFSLIGIHSKQG